MGKESKKHGIKDVLAFVELKANTEPDANSLVRTILTVIWGWAQVEQLRLSRDDRKEMVQTLRETFQEKNIDIDEFVQNDRSLQEAWSNVAA